MPNMPQIAFSMLIYFNIEIGADNVPDIRIKELKLKCTNVWLGGYYNKIDQL